MLDKITCTKSVCEKYYLSFNNGWDYASFTIDDSGIFSCQSSFGNYGYCWSAFGDDFKSFLCSLRKDYLLTKLCKKDYFNTQEYISKCKELILKMRYESKLTKEEAREAFDFYSNELDDYNDNLELVTLKLMHLDIVDKISMGDFWHSKFCPDLDYNPSDKYFVEFIYPAFINILKQELNK